MSDYLNTGERISFAELLKDNTISIPLIQRDYVQGRLVENEVRTDFLNALLGYLEEGKPFRDLDSIYGYLDNENTLYPLDGQQRLTTLMLLHWFLANKEVNKFETYKNLFLVEKESRVSPKFTYENRISSKEFCKQLFTLELDFNTLLPSDINKNNSLSKTIKNFSWYALIWDYDPSVQNMLHMLDAMYPLFINEEEYFDSLVGATSPIITFLFMDLGKNNLTDDLYIKMNSRGVPLSIFENFKAKLESFININKKHLKGEFDLIIDSKAVKVDLKKYYTHMLDGDWSNMVWNSIKNKDSEIEHPENFDVIWTNIYRISFLHSILKNDVINKGISPVLREFLNNSKQFSYYDYCTRFLKSDNELLVIINPETINEFISLLDQLKKNIAILDEFEYFSATPIFNDLILTDYKTAKYSERLLFYSFTEFLIYHKNEFSIDSLKAWMRLMNNLIKNTAPYNNIQEFINSVKAINGLIKHSDNIDKYISNLPVNEELNGFDSLQFKEEILKRKLEDAEPSWKTIIKETELHPYLEGQINFLFMLVEINEISIDNFPNEDNLKFQAEFITFFTLFKQLFTDSGLNQKISRNGNFVFERALLSIGDYTISEGYNKSFLIDKDRDISWKRFFKLDKKNEHKMIVKTLFQSLTEYNLDIEEGLKNIIETNKDLQVWWRFLFVNNKELLSYFKNSNRYFRENSNHGFVLLKGERVSGEHAEIESYNFYLNEKDNFKLDGYYFVSGENTDEIPCAFLDFTFEKLSYAVDIRFIQNQFNLAVKRRSFEPFDDKLINLLETQGFNYLDFFTKSVGSYEECKTYLRNLLNHVKSL